VTKGVLGYEHTGCFYLYASCPPQLGFKFTCLRDEIHSISRSISTGRAAHAAA
jgi:hypothetical protein